MATESKLRMAGLEPWRSERRSRDPSPELGLGEAEILALSWGWGLITTHRIVYIGAQ